MKILVTGGTGFLGKHLQNAFIRHNLDMSIGINDALSDINFINRKSVDLRNQREVNQYFSSYQYTHVIHLAASVGGIGANLDNPGKFSYENLIMGCNVVEASRVNKVRQLICVGTVCSYPSETPIPFREEDLWKGYPEPTNAYYGIAKKAIQNMLEGYYRQYNMDSAYLIPVNMYGEYDNFSPESSHVIPALIKKVLDNDTGVISVWGTGRATREFVYAGDVANAIISSIDTLSHPDPVNIGSGEEISMSQLIKLLIELCDKPMHIVYDTSKPDGQLRRLISSERAATYLGYESKMSLTDGLRRTIEWYKENNGNS